MTAAWTSQQEDRLRELVKNKALSAADIGREVGKSRSAVIGKLNRLNIPLPHAVGPRKWIQREPKEPRAKALRTTHTEPVQRVSVPKVPEYRDPVEAPPAHGAAVPREGKSLFKTCQWYFGDPKAGDWRKCPHPTAGASSFCEDHHRRVYVPVPTSPKKRRP